MSSDDRTSEQRARRRIHSPQSQAIHFNEDDAVVGLAPRGLLQGELYEVMIVGEDRGSQANCARKVTLVLRSQHSFFVGRSGLHAAPPQPLGDSKVYIFIRVDP